MTARNGRLSINSDNIFPIIKKWLYSDQDIFIRELISNGCDAITKLKKLDMAGETTLDPVYVGALQVIVNPVEKTLQFIDNGIGMTADEVEEYINQIAFSGATDFLEKYKDKANDDQIIGHFGLGFYSAFMVADEVHIDTLSFREGATAVHWECDGGTEFSMEEGDRHQVGTTITLFLNEDCLAYANEYRAREVLEKYCSFMPLPIYLSKADAEPAGEDEKEPTPINEIHPLWNKHPNECSEEEYKTFYRKVFSDYKEPLFWIHLNMDYPFRLKGILYFPKINTEYDSIEGTIKLYNNQVFIADNIKEVIPEFLMLLKGVIDCPDLPLNVSRSALQNDGFVKKISDYITKKVADKLTGMCKTDKENYEKYWNDICPFIKYGCLRDEKFCDRMNDSILFENLKGKFLTLPELLKKETDAAEKEPAFVEETGDSEVVTEEPEEAEDKRQIVYYVTDPRQQGQYISLFREQGTEAVLLTHNIDTSFISQLEVRNASYRFVRIDASLGDALKEEEAEIPESTEALETLFRNALGQDSLTVSSEKLKNSNVASILTLSEESRRMQDMMRAYGLNNLDSMPMEATLTLNTKHPLVAYLLEHPSSEHADLFCRQLYDLARLANHPLSAEDMQAFLSRSNEIMLLLAEK